MLSPAQGSDHNNIIYTDGYPAAYNGWARVESEGFHLIALEGQIWVSDEDKLVI